MSLLDEYLKMYKFHIVDKTTVSDGLGGVRTEWKEGAEVEVALQQDNSIAAQIAQSESERQIYTVVTRKSVVFRHDDLIKRDSDGKTFRITSDSDDLKTPNSSHINMRQCKAEEVVLT